MPYLYKYTDSSGVIRYIGIIRSDSNFPRRFKQHQDNDNWCKNLKKCKIEYCYYTKIADVEILEAHLIASHKKTVVNNAKREWGECSFVPYGYEETINWKVYEKGKTMESDLREYDTIDDAIKKLSTEILALGECYSSEIAKIRAAQDRILCDLEKKDKSIAVYIKKNIREIRNNIIWGKATDVYNDYCTWMKVNMFCHRPSFSEFKEKLENFGFTFKEGRAGDVIIVQRSQLQSQLQRLKLTGDEISDFLERLWCEKDDNS